MHDKHCEEIQSGNVLQQHNATTNGVERSSILNTSKYFHVVDGMPPDIMHDILEGCYHVLHVVR